MRCLRDTDGLTGDPFELCLISVNLLVYLADSAKTDQNLTNMLRRSIFGADVIRGAVDAVTSGDHHQARRTP